MSTCWACKGDEGMKLAKALYKLTAGRLNLYLNQDYSMRTYNEGLVDIWTGKPLSRQVENGWVKIWAGAVNRMRKTTLKGDGRTGNIRLDSRPGKEAINIE